MAATKKISLKKIQLDKTNRTIYLVVLSCSVIAALALVSCKSFISESLYYRKVLDKKEKAVSQLKSNESALGTLKESYETFVSQDPNAIGGRLSGVADRDGDNAKLILDALPSTYDFPALVSSLEKILSGYKIDGISGTDDYINQSQIQNPGELVEIPFTISVTTDYEGLVRLNDILNKSIRPITVKTIDISGQSPTLTVVINAKTYYQTPKSMEVKTEVVR